MEVNEETYNKALMNLMLERDLYKRALELIVSSLGGGGINIENPRDVGVIARNTLKGEYYTAPGHKEINSKYSDLEQAFKMLK